MVLRKAGWAKKPMRRTQNASAVQPRVAALAERIARGQLRVLWPQVVRENHLHLRDGPGIHLDEGTYANQLRYHDSGGVLRGILVLYHEAEDGEKEAEYEWDHRGDQDQQPGCIWIVVDPKRLRQGIGKALLNEAVRRRNWPIDFDKQRKTLAGAILIRKFRESLRP